MARLSPLKASAVVRKLRRLGFDGPFPGGKHQRMVHPETGKVIPIPIHKGKDIGVGLLMEFIRELGISREEWIDL